MSVAVLLSPFMPGAADEETLTQALDRIRQIRGQYGPGSTLLTGSFDPLAALQAAAAEDDPAQTLAEMIAMTGYDALISGGFTAEEIAAYAALAEYGVNIPAANVYYDGTDGEHEAGENVTVPYVTRDVYVDSRAHTIGILTLTFRAEKREGEDGLLFTHPYNPDGSMAWEAARYIRMMQEEDACEFIIVCCSGDADAPADPEGGETTLAEEMVRAGTGIDLLMLPKAPEDMKTAGAMTDGSGKKIPVLREGDEPAGAVLKLKEDKEGNLVCSEIRKMD